MLNITNSDCICPNDKFSIDFNKHAYITWSLIVMFSACLLLVFDRTDRFIATLLKIFVIVEENFRATLVPQNLREARARVRQTDAERQATAPPSYSQLMQMDARLSTLPRV